MGNTPSQNVTESLQALLHGEVKLYNASDRLLRGRMNGQDYFFPPNEVVVVKDCRDHPMDKLTALRQMDRDPVVVLQAAQVAQHLLTDGGLADQGLTHLTGNVEQDEERRREARMQYIKNRVAHARLRQGYWLTLVEEVQKTPGAIPPRMPPDIAEEIQFLKRHEQDVLLDGRKPVLCLIDSAEFDTVEDAEEYIRTTYSRHYQQFDGDCSQWILDLAAQKAGIQESFRKARENQQKTPGESPEIEAVVTETAQGLAAAMAPKAEPDPGGALIAKAEELGASGKITKDELKGLLKRDPKIIKAVEKKLAEIEASREPVAT